MEATVIDTLRYAHRLKAAGVETGQAEAMSRALNDELAGGVATKDDLGHAVDELKGDIAQVDAKVGALDAKCDAKFEAVDAKLEAMDAKLEAMDAKFEAKFEAIGTQGRYVFLVLALIAALGLYNAVSPRFPTQTGSPNTAPTSPLPATQPAAT